MAGWWTALKLVPWGEVVRSAPQIAEGARKLWQSVGSGSVARRPRAAPGEPPVPVVAGQEAQVLAALSTRVTQLERELAEASGLIHSMAEQDQQLVGQVARLQQRLRWQGAVLVVLALVVAALVAQWMSR